MPERDQTPAPQSFFARVREGWREFWDIVRMMEEDSRHSEMAKMGIRRRAHYESENQYPGPM